MRHSARLAIVLTAIAGMTLAAGRASAACPGNLCDCLGEAGRYAVVANQLQVKSGKISYSGYAYPIPTFIEGTSCSQTGKIGGIEATIDPPILAPGAKVLAKGYSILSNVIGGSKTKLQGPELADAPLCP